MERRLPLMDALRFFCLPIRRFLAVSIFAVGLTHVQSAPVTVSPDPLHAAAILQELDSFQQFGRILYIAAHPDDENTRLLSYFAKGRGYRTGYLSLTRGDGGQNLIGSELRDNLGVIRTQELLAARRIDGAIQFFSRANDFGFSKHPDETFRIWDRNAVLADVVRVIRAFRPDVIVTRFSLEPGVTHGHHTASAILALEAFRLAADPTTFPEQIQKDRLQPWQVTRIAWNSFPAAMRGGGIRQSSPTLSLDTGGYNPLLGESFGEIAARSRTQHKSQGFGTLAGRGTALDYFQILAGEPATRDLFDGIDTSWRRITEAPQPGELARKVAGAFDPRAPEKSVPALLELRTRLHELTSISDQTRWQEKCDHLDRILLACLGFHAETSVPAAEVVAGGSLPLTLRALVRRASPETQVRWVSSRLLSTGSEVAINAALAINQSSEFSVTAKIPTDAQPSTPYWLQKPGTEGMFRVEDSDLIGRPENPPVFPVEHTLDIDGQTLIVADRAVQVIDDPIRGEIRRPVQVIPPVTLGFGQDLELFRPGETRNVTVTVTGSRESTEGTVSLSAPRGWTANPVRHNLNLKEAGARERFTFSVTAPASSTQAILAASAEVKGRYFSTSRTDIRYDHIPAQLIQPQAHAKIASLDLKVRGETVGYLPGAGDLVGEGIARMGYRVTTLTSMDLTVERLRSFDVVVLGVRAFNTRPDIGPLLPALFAYVEGGGTVVVQYNTTMDLQTTVLAPFPLTLSRDRVVDETAPVKLLAPDHPALTTPNRITVADFDGWVQERGLYFPNTWADSFVPLLECADEGEAPKRGSLLVARHGQGYFVYTGLSFFRELPAGVPGAYRLFANLLSLGK